MPSFHVENFGCRAARADGEAVSARLQSEGMSELSLGEADVVVINTCSVTAEADRDARAFLRKTQRLNPSAQVVVTGCYAQRAPEEIAALPGVTAVVGNSHKGLLPEIIQQLVQHPGTAASSSLVPLPSMYVDDRFAHSSIESGGEHSQVVPGAQTRPNLKIQEGCSNRCTFCIIPTTRGNSRSLAASKVLTQVHGFVAAGGKELVLSGINLGRWGQDLPSAPGEPSNFADLVRQILNETDLPRLRLSSIEPMDWTADLISLVREFSRSARIARHAHLPLQSGSDAVLRRMHRRYRPWHYAAKVAALVPAAGPQMALGADVMVGFPGETEAEFQETYDFLASQPFTYLHLFPFSARPGTRGWDMHRQFPVAPQAVNERMTALRELIVAKTLAFRGSQVGRTLPAITLQTQQSVSAKGHTSALTDNYIPVEIEESLPANQLVHLTMTRVEDSAYVRARLRTFATRPSGLTSETPDFFHTAKESLFPVAAGFPHH
jgi:threonylcarbamoyladenosine tRNA methylthiotransferase MtaB